MNITKIDNRTPILTEHLMKIWESAVRVTHTFLSEEEIMRIKEYVSEAVQAVRHLLVAVDENDIPIAFVGIEGHKIEMLFVDADYHGQGIGGCLIRYVVEHYRINEVTVNEQNPQAVNFYKHMGFHIYKRTDFDEQGAAYPLLYMRLDK